MAYSGAFHPRTPEPEPVPPPPAAEESAPPPSAAPRSQSRRMPFDLGSLFQKTEVAGMETDDLLMALILYLMYRESGDTDLLIMLGVMLLV